MTNDELTRQRGQKFGYPPCCIEAFIQGRTGMDVWKEYDIFHTQSVLKDGKHISQRSGSKTDNEVFGKLLHYVPCKKCCGKLIAGEMIMTNKDLLLQFKKEVYDREVEIDPNADKDWNDLACGFFLGLGATIDQATDYKLLCAANTGSVEINDG